MEDIYIFTTMHREVTPEEADRCRELIKKLKKENDSESQEKPSED